MNFNYTDSSVRQGRQNQERASKSPNTFGTQSGVDDVTQTTRLDQPSQRMAGQIGNRLKEYMTNPEEQQRTDNWMATFELSNEGKQFNQAKMGGGPPA